MTRTYNGWTNYETWNVALWIGNDQGSYNYWQDVTRECLAEASPDKNFTIEERAKIALAGRLKDEIEEGNPLAKECSLYSDILTANLKEVHYYEIASNWIDDIKE